MQVTLALPIAPLPAGSAAGRQCRKLFVTTGLPQARKAREGKPLRETE